MMNLAKEVLNIKINKKGIRATLIIFQLSPKKVEIRKMTKNAQNCPSVMRKISKMKKESSLLLRSMMVEADMKVM